jgi:hypothetical protein
VHEYLDLAGRPVGEGRSTAFQDVQTEMRPCPYAGSRHRHAKPMNATALQQMPPWQHVLTMLRWLSGRYRTRHQARIANSNDLAQVTGAGVFLVDFLVLRSRAGLGSGEIPALISGLYKVCLGFQLAYLPDRFSGETPTDLPDAAGFLEYLENNDLLIGEAEVCSGTPAMILQAYDAILSGPPVAPEALPSPCESLQIAWDQFDEFTKHAIDIWREAAMYAIRMPEFLPEISHPRVPRDVQARLNTLLRQHGNELLQQQTGLMIEIARTVQTLAGAPADEPPRAPPSTHALPVPKPGSLAATVLAWLSAAAGADVEAHAPEVASALRARLDPYDCYEASVLAELNRHLSGLMNSLDLDPGAPSGPAALSRLCGRTLRDWESLKENDELSKA